MKTLVTCSIGCFIGIVFGAIVAQNLANMTLEDLHDRSCQIVCRENEPPERRKSTFMAVFGAGAFTAGGLGIFGIAAAKKLVPEKKAADVERCQ